MSHNKGWIKTLKTWIADSDPTQRSVYKNAIREAYGIQPERPMHMDIAPMAKGVDGQGKWWADRKSRGE